MKLASLKTGGRDGTLIIVDRDLDIAVPAERCGVRTLQDALDNWNMFAPKLEVMYRDLNQDEFDAFPFNPVALASPLPRAYQWLDGSAYLTHVERVRKARGVEMPPNYLSDPLMYQGHSGGFLGPRDPISLVDDAWGLDFEAEVAVITDDVPMGIRPQEARAHIKLVMLVNDISLRGLIQAELAKGFGFLHGKPGCAFSPVAVTPEELGTAWDGGRLHLPIEVRRNGKRFGQLDAGADMQFDFPALISHAAKTRQLPAGTIIGSGTISNADALRGCACIAEQRVLEILDRGVASTPFLANGERVGIEMFDAHGHSLFGAIEQEVQVCPR
jgi:fumarylacetoacetate (FAA) hydrolase